MHHSHMLEYEETSAEVPKPSISFEVADPANDKEKDWNVTVVSAVCVSYTCCSFASFSCLISSFPHSFSHSLVHCIFKCKDSNDKPSTSCRLCRCPL